MNFTTAQLELAREVASSIRAARAEHPTFTGARLYMAVVQRSGEVFKPIYDLALLLETRGES